MGGTQLRWDGEGQGWDGVETWLGCGWDWGGTGVGQVGQGNTGVRFGVDYGFSVIIMVISRNVRIIIISSIVIIHLIININGKKVIKKKSVIESKKY